MEIEEKRYLSAGVANQRGWILGLLAAILSLSSE
jgi:hypothetical protein